MKENIYAALLLFGVLITPYIITFISVVLDIIINGDESDGGW